MTSTGPGSLQRDLQRQVDELDADTLRWALDAARFVRNPVFVGAVFSGLLVMAGVAILVLSGLGANDQFYVSLQLPYVISGGFGALGLLVTGAVFASVLGNRRDEAMADQELADVLDELAVVVRWAVAQRHQGSTP